MSKRLRIPFTAPLQPPIIYPPTANSLSGAIDAIASFLSSPASPLLRGTDVGRNEQTVLLTGAGISVASGLADYRGHNGIYRRNVTYRPIYFHEFVGFHEKRKRYWARSFMGWPTMASSKPNAAHWAIGELGRKGYISSIVTQNVDSFHHMASPAIPTIELHGYLRSVICINCHHTLPRDTFQQVLIRLNPVWAEFLERMLETGALNANDVDEQRQKGLRINPDGDVELPYAHYSGFRYPPCPRCLEQPPLLPDGTKGIVETDKDGAWSEKSTAGILKPAVVMFGESVNDSVRKAAEEAIDEAGKILVMGSTLATFSALRLVQRAKLRGMSVGILNVGGVRDEASLFEEDLQSLSVMTRVRCSQKAELVLPEVAARLDAIR
ncbi:hypothetical protein VTO42DRAFT_7435 [Malbranchea cinnamomea]